jgi:hypothetical protein
MIKKTAGRRKSTKSGNLHKAARKKVKARSARVASLMPTGSPQRTASDIAAATGGALLAAATIGVGPAALAGVAGYIAYRETWTKVK